MFTFVLYLSHAIILAECMFSYGSYKAAIVEYNPIREPFHQPEDILNFNADEYVKYINEAFKKGASIIVFPEYGLTTTDPLKSQEKLMAYTIEVPDPIHKPNPCINESLNKQLRMISCAAKDSNIYVVVNLLENQRDGNSRIIYNTNIVFDRNGTIITRYRKINLHDEPNISQGSDLVTFTTDFGVTFGMLIGYDIIYNKPALGIIREKNVTDIIYSAAWTSETPYLQALSVQAGYGRAFGVNLLAAGLNDPDNKNGGSGIYLYNGEVAELYISPSKSSKLLVQEVPKIHIKLSAVKCNNNSHDMPRFRLGGNLNVGSFSTLSENMTTHTMVSLNQHGLETQATLCNFNGLYCCKFQIVLERGLTASDPVYRMILFYGVRRLGARTVGIRSCGLISCLNHNKNTCGLRKENSRSNVKFTKIAIEGTFTKSSETYDQPITLTYDLTPITEYTYCETLTSGKKHVKAEMISTRPLTNLITFGIHGRLYDYDGTNEGIITSNVGRLYANTILMIVLFVLIKF